MDGLNVVVDIEGPRSTDNRGSEVELNGSGNGEGFRRSRDRSGDWNGGRSDRNRGKGSHWHVIGWLAASNNGLLLRSFDLLDFSLSSKSPGASDLLELSLLDCHFLFLFKGTLTGELILREFNWGGVKGDRFDHGKLDFLQSRLQFWLLLFMLLPSMSSCAFLLRCSV